MEFRLKHLTSKLLESQNDETFRSLYSQVINPRRVTFDDAAMDLIADKLELDTEGVVADISRYVRGRFRAKSHGPGGNRLGDFAEGLVYLVCLADKRTPVRVVRTDPVFGLPKKGERFPQPDFIIRQGLKLRALEIKSTEALVLKDLLQAQRWKYLQPCARVENLRRDALQQLGYDKAGKKVASGGCQLVLLNGPPCPFPVDEAEAAAVLALDGRALGLKPDLRFKTRKACRLAHRNCWECLNAGGSPAHLTLTTLQNAPGRLGLLGSGNAGDTWLASYARWEEALWARELDAVRTATKSLAAATMDWVQATQDRLLGAQRNAIPEKMLPRIRKAWGNFPRLWATYLEDCLLDRSLELAADPLAPLYPIERSDEDRARRSREPRVAPASGPLLPLELTHHRLSFDRHLAAGSSFSFIRQPEGWEVRMCSSSWWAQLTGMQVPAPIQALEHDAAECLRFALGSTAASLVMRSVPLGEVRADVDNEKISLGWRAIPISEGGGWQQLDGLPPWAKWLAFGDPRAHLRVFPDGRVHLRVNQST